MLLEITNRHREDYKMTCSARMSDLFDEHTDDSEGSNGGDWGQMRLGVPTS
jgi:hypothetical protein